MRALARASIVLGVGACLAPACTDQEPVSAPDRVQVARRPREVEEAVWSRTADTKMLFFEPGTRWAQPSEELRFFTGPVPGVVTENEARCVSLVSGNVLARFVMTDGYAFTDWFVELERSDAGWQPVAALWSDITCTGGMFAGEGELTGEITFDPRSNICLFDTKGSMSVAFHVDTAADSRELRNLLDHGMGEALGLRLK